MDTYEVPFDEDAIKNNFKNFRPDLNFGQGSEIVDIEVRDGRGEGFDGPVFQVTVDIPVDFDTARRIFDTPFPQ